jgi:hypothetical protein
VRNAIEGSSPALCNTHRVVFADVGRPPQRVPGQTAIDVLNDLLSGQRVSRDRVKDAVGDLFAAWSMGGNIAQGYYPDISGQDAPTGDPFRDFHREQGRQRRSPQFDPELAELQEARRRARIVMGFAETEPITREQLRARYRDLVRKHHPDLGGSLEKMKLVNAANDVLEAELA